MHEVGDRRRALKLNDDLATALLRLLEQALGETDGGLTTTEAAQTEPAAPVTLN